jgi:hypothetical protein
MMTPEQMKLLRIAVTAILEAIQATGDSGAPAGVLYAALMAYGCTHSQFESVMGSLEHMGLVRRDGFLYYLASRGEAMLNHAAK